MAKKFFNFQFLFQFSQKEKKMELKTNISQLSLL